MKCIIGCFAVCLAFAAANSTYAVTNLLTNSGFLDVTPDVTGSGSPYGDGWGFFGATDANAFFGASHASVFADNAGNAGGFFQQGILGTPGTLYQFDLINVRIEENWDADVRFGVEFYAADDATLLDEIKVLVDASTRLANGSIDGNVFSMQATAPPGTVFARPIVQFDNVNPAYVGQSQANLFVFNSYLSEAPAPGGELLKNPDFDDENGQGGPGDFWGSFGAAGFHNFFGPNNHASLFSDAVGNFGGIFQQSILGAGATYEFSLNDVRIEENFDADLSFGLEFFGDDDFTKIGDTIVAIDPNTGQVDGNAFVMSGTAPAGTVYVRPIVSFNNVVSTAEGQENVFVFDASLVQLSATEDANFDGDDDVDGIDFLTWQRGFGGSGEGDANGSGAVDATDLAIWESQYGNAALQPALGAVPEPSSIALSLMAVVAIARRRGR